MSYAHMMYGVDLDRLKALWGSKDGAALEQILSAQADELDSNDEFFDDMRDDEDEEDDDEGGGFPDSRTALQEIVAGSVPERDGGEAVYGYVLKILCEHLGESLGSGDIAEISQHPYPSQLVANGSPLPIPIDHGDFPEIGHLPLDQIPDELRRIDEAIAAGAKPRPDITWKPMDSDELIEDMQAYRDVLVEAQTRGLSVVSFRH